MSLALSMTRLETFARLHEGRPGDAHALWGLSERLPGGLGGEHPIWQTLLQAEDAHVLVATECQLLVGAIVTWHHKGAELARLAWLGVDASARHRGIGRLLLETGIARAEIASAVVAHVPVGAADLQALLGKSGFVSVKGGELRLQMGASS
ncbi:MAG: N-acetyltransferase [Alphaproteobacteria bacterium]|nr:MAG: N-acetyltransferase [Alphaproteobacteria bacterium]